MASLADLFSGATNDYKQLLSAYPNANKFVNALRGNIGRNVPTQADLSNPQSLADWATAAALNAPMGLAIKVYHGSPHRFDKFDMSKIGTGEGAQAYGHGLYFAENPAVAEEYKKALSARGSDEKFKLQYHRDMAKLRGDFEKAKELDDKIKSNYGQNIYNVSLEWPDKAREAVDPLSPEHFLDWDKPLSEQGQYIKDALNSIGIKDKQPLAPFKLEYDGDQYNIIDGHTSSYLPVSYATEDAAKEALLKLNKQRDDNFNAWKRYGFDIYNQAKDNTRDYTGKKASLALKNAGIPGIRYLDQGSRGSGAGTSNYVTFSDLIPNIISRR